MSTFHQHQDRPKKVKAITEAIAAGFKSGCFERNFRNGIVYYTLGGVRFNDLRIFYNVFNGLIKRAISYEEDVRDFTFATKEAKKLNKNGTLGTLPLRVLPENILESDLREVPRENFGLILFLDLTGVLAAEHQATFKRWVVGHCLVPGDLIFVTSSLPPWEIIRDGFRAELEPILKGYGATAQQLASKQFWKERYIPVLMDHFAERWHCHGHSRRGFRHFYGTIYRDTRFEMALNAFEVI